ncbi:MAG: hypothetical protein R3F20_18735 [Planctomycetota bacterium]
MNARILIAGLLVLAGAAWAGLEIAGRERSPSAADRPYAVDGDLTLVSARPFRLERAMRHTWRAEAPSFDRGVLAVLRASDPELVRRRPVATPVVVWGDETVEVMNDGGANGHIVVILPLLGDREAADLATRPIFFGAARLAESIRAADAIEEEAAALARGLGGPGAEAIGGETLVLEDESALYRAAGALVAEHSPSEKDLIAWLKGDPMTSFPRSPERSGSPSPRSCSRRRWRRRERISRSPRSRRR